MLSACRGNGKDCWKTAEQENFFNNCNSEQVGHVIIFLDLKKNVCLWSRWQTEAIWKHKGSHTALEKDVITCFTYAALEAAERKDAARCQVEPAGEAAWHTVVWCQPHLGPRRRRAPQGTSRSPGYSTSRSCPSPPPFTSDCGKTLQMERDARSTGCSVKGNTFKDTQTVSDPVC